MTPEITAAWTTSGATILLALFAFLAWRASANSLKSMQNQERDSKRAAQAQVDDQNWGRQIESLANYSAVLVDLKSIPGLMKKNEIPVPVIGSPFVQLVSARGTDEIRNLLARVQSTGLIWRMHHVRQTQLIWKLEALELEVRLLGIAAVFGIVEWANVREATRELLELAEAWQEEPENREEVAKKVENLQTEYAHARHKRDQDLENAE